MIFDFTIKDIREYIEKTSGLEFIRIIKVEEICFKEKKRLKWYYSVRISISKVEDICKLVESKLLCKDEHLRNENHSINSSVGFLIEENKLRDL